MEPGGPTSGTVKVAETEVTSEALTAYPDQLSESPFEFRIIGSRLVWCTVLLGCSLDA
jgi:hypothetical protein